MDENCEITFDNERRKTAHWQGFCASIARAQDKFLRTNWNPGAVSPFRQGCGGSRRKIDRPYLSMNLENYVLFSNDLRGLTSHP